MNLSYCSFALGHQCNISCPVTQSSIKFCGYSISKQIINLLGPIYKLTFIVMTYCGKPCISGKSSGQRIPVPWFNIKITSYQYRKSHCGDKTILRPSYLHNGISCTGKMSSLYWIGALVFILAQWAEDGPGGIVNVRGSRPLRGNYCL